MDRRNNNHTVKMLLQSLILLGLLLGSNAQCPNEVDCSCFPDDSGLGTVINCRSKGLTSIPEFSSTSDTFYLLNLANNEITTIGEEAFFTTAGVALKVKKIDLEANDIATIDTNAFTGLTETTEILLQLAKIGFPMAVTKMPQLQVLSIKEALIPRLPDQALQLLTSLRELTLLSCNLENLSATDLTEQAGTLEVLDLGDNSLAEVPTDALSILGKLHTLRLNQNHFTGLPSGGFSSLPKLKIMDLSRNTIQSVNTDAFRGLDTTLEDLNLFFCRLHDVNLKPLSRLRALKKLNLNNNEFITQLPVNLFENMGALEELTFESCALQFIDPNSFRGIGNSLLKLDLASNKIVNIAANSFNGFTTLQKLYLNANDLSATFNPNTFRGLEDSLTELNLDGTNMNTDHLKAISYLFKLEILKLNSNQITSLPDFIFSHLQHLDNIEFNANSLTTVPAAAMYGLQDTLKTINLKTNKIGSISHCAFRGFNLDIIYLANNPLICDCHARWLREFLDKFNAFDQAQFKWQCAGPPEHALQYVRDIPAVEFVCPAGEVIEVCDDLTTPVMTLPPDISSTPDPDAMLLKVNTTDATENEIMLIWHVEGGIVTSFLVEATEIKDMKPDDPPPPPVFNEGVDADERNKTVDGLQPGTAYNLCVTAYNQQTSGNHVTACTNATTAGSFLPVTKEPSKLAIILGSVLGVLFFIVLLVIVIVVVRRSSAASHPYDKNNGFPETRADLPTMGYNSKRFSKPRSTMTSIGSSREDLERKLDGFSPEERNRILQLLSSSTLSMASAGSVRYLDEPRPHRWTGGASGYYNEPDEEHYQEIPQGEGYEYIPADQVTRYDYIPADQVMRPRGISKANSEPQLSPPPLPPPHPESNQPPTLIINDGLSQPVPHETPLEMQMQGSEWI